MSLRRALAADHMTYKENDYVTDGNLCGRVTYRVNGTSVRVHWANGQTSHHPDTTLRSVDTLDYLAQMHHYDMFAHNKKSRGKQSW
jgi:hypothetical protein